MKRFILLLLISMVGASINAQIPTDGLVAYYPFNGNANDESGNGNNGTVYGATLTSDRFGSPNQAYNYDGIDDYIQLPPNTYFNGNFSTSGWLYLRSYGSGIVLYDFSNGNDNNNVREIFTVNSNPNHHFQIIEGSNTTGANLFCSQNVWLDEWIHLVVTLSGYQLKFYINGEFINSVSSLYTPPNEIRDINYFGKSSYSGSSTINGKIDDMRIYNRALSETEITALYNEGQSWACGDPINYEGQQYNTVQIGTQCWMAENLNVGTRINGNYSQSNNELIEKYCYNNEESNCSLYGGLYQWNEFMSYSPSSDTIPNGVQGICPSGWHIPTKTEFTQLINLLGGLNIAGGPMKDTGITHWNSPNVGATNSSGFTALGSGVRYIDGQFYYLGLNAYFGTSSDGSFYGVWSPALYNSSTAITWGSGDWIDNGFSVRCIKDELPIGLNSDFSAEPLEGVAPLTVQFTDESTGVPSVWIWDFQNDGVNDSFIQNPTFTYEEPGEYSVRLIVINSTETDTLVQEDYISVNPASTQDGLVAYYPFNSNANDESGNGNHGTVYGATLVPDRFGNQNSAYLFNGLDNQIRIPTSPSLENFSTVFTISAWVNMSSYFIDFKFPILDKWEDCGSYGSSQFMAYAVNIPTEGLAIQSINCNVQAVLFGKANELPSLNSWEFVTYRYDGDYIDVFVNGIFKYSEPNNSNVYITDGDLVIGKNEFADDAWADGLIDDIRIYNRSLSNNEILELYNENQITTPEICIVSVTPDEHNQVIWEKEPSDIIQSYNIYRETTQTNVYEVIGSVNYEDSSIFVDMTSNPNQRPYKYKLSAVSNTGTETALSNYHKTIHLTINQGPTGWNLIWSPYEGFPFTTYYIYRGTTSTELTLLDSISGSFTSYTDINPPWGPLYYTIEVVNEEGCNPTREDGYSRSRSNVQYNGIVGIGDNAEPGIKIYPNPAHDVLNIYFDGEERALDAEVIISDIHGKIALSQRLQTDKTSMGIANLKPGVYIIRVKYGQSVVINKLMVF